MERSPPGPGSNALRAAPDPKPRAGGAKALGSSGPSRGLRAPAEPVYHYIYIYIYINNLYIYIYINKLYIYIYIYMYTCGSRIRGCGGARCGRIAASASRRGVAGAGPDGLGACDRASDEGWRCRVACALGLLPMTGPLAQRPQDQGSGVKQFWGFLLSGEILTYEQNHLIESNSSELYTVRGLAVLEMIKTITPSMAIPCAWQRLHTYEFHGTLGLVQPCLRLSAPHAGSVLDPAGREILRDGAHLLVLWRHQAFPVPEQAAAPNGPSPRLSTQKRIAYRRRFSW